MRVLFFSRGRGRGHAVPDVALVEDLIKARHDLNLSFVSYSTGGSTIQDLGHDFIDLGLPEENAFVETLLRSTRLINSEKPDLIVSHEEFAALPAAKGLGVPAVFLSDWLPTGRGILIDCLTCADEVIFLDEAGYFDVPDVVKDKIYYVGPVLRAFNTAPSNKAVIRAEFGISGEAKVILVMPGGASISTEDKAPICDLVLDAFDLLPFPSKYLIWVVNGADFDRLNQRTKGRTDIISRRPHTDIERTMIASDVAITKASRMTCLELHALGIPSISISYGLNPIDDYRVPRIRSNRALRASALTSRLLCYHLETILTAVEPPPHLRDCLGMSRAMTVKRLLDHVARAGSATSSH
jgi:UDP-N-acetylglucosamine:LPS N-acetylglucosamine transferase